MAILELKDICKDYIQGKEPVHVLKHIDLTVEQGDYLAIMGPSGSGKTTLMNIIGCLDLPTSGSYTLNGENLQDLSDDALAEIRNKYIGFVFQGFYLLPKMNALDNVALPLELAGTDRKTARAEAMRYFEQFGLQGTEDRYPAQLSGGMRQRAALLRTYLFGKSVALLDEPFSALDTITKSAIHRWYLDVMEQIHLSTLFITHDIDEAILLSDRIYILSGRPGHITDEIHINVPKPRAGDFTLTPEFLAYKRQIIEAMHLS